MAGSATASTVTVADVADVADVAFDQQRRSKQFGERQRRQRFGLGALDCRHGGHDSGPGTDRYLGHGAGAGPARASTGHAC